MCNLRQSEGYSFLKKQVINNTDYENETNIAQLRQFIDAESNATLSGSRAEHVATTVTSGNSKCNALTFLSQDRPLQFF